MTIMTKSPSHPSYFPLSSHAKNHFHLRYFHRCCHQQHNDVNDHKCQPKIIIIICWCNFNYGLCWCQLKQPWSIVKRIFHVNSNLLLSLFLMLGTKSNATDYLKALHRLHIDKRLSLNFCIKIYSSL